MNSDPKMENIEIEKTPIEGVLIIKPRVFRDKRGYFVEKYRRDKYADLGIDQDFVQDNHSVSTYGTLRGMHFQKNFPQGKLVSVSLGAIYDVALDIRPNSPTFGKWFGVALTDENQWQLWIAPGLAHGFAVLSEVAHFHYKCTEFYHPEDEGAVRWNDPIINIAWPLENPLLSPKDKAAPLFAALIKK